MSKLDGKWKKILAAMGLIITTIIWGSGFVVMKNSLNVISPTYLLAIRFTIASVALTGVFIKQVKAMGKQDIICGGLLGLFLFCGYFFQTYGLNFTTASKNAFITTLYVILVPFLHWIFNKIRPSKNNMAAAFISVAGLALLSFEGNFSVNVGDLLTLVCGLFFAFHIVFIDRYTTDHDPIALTVIQMWMAAVLCWLVAPVLEGGFHFSVVDGGMVINFLYLGIFSTMIGFLLQNVGQKFLSPNTSSILLSFESVFGLVFSVIFLGDPLTKRLIAGCILMFGAVLLSEYKKKSDSPSKTKDIFA